MSVPKRACGRRGVQEAQTLAELRGHAIEGWHTKGAELERAVREGSEALGRKREKKRALKARANELSAALEQARAEGAAFRAATDAQLQRSGERLGRLEGQLVALATGHGGRRRFACARGQRGRLASAT